MQGFHSETTFFQGPVWRFKLIFILIFISEMHGVGRVNIGCDPQIDQCIKC